MTLVPVGVTVGETVPVSKGVAVLPGRVIGVGAGKPTWLTRIMPFLTNEGAGVSAACCVAGCVVGWSEIL